MMEEYEVELTSLDFLILQLEGLRDYNFIEEVLSKYDVISYDTLPEIVSKRLEDIFEERLLDIGEEEIEA